MKYNFERLPNELFNVKETNLRNEEKTIDL